MTGSSSPVMLGLVTAEKLGTSRVMATAPDLYDLEEVNPDRGG